MSLMATDEHPGSSTNKRNIDEIVDPDDGNVISNAKKSRVAPDTTKKVKCLKFIIECFVNIKNKLNETLDPAHLNISLSNQIINLVFATFNANRQRANGLTGSAERKAKEKSRYTITSTGKTYTIEFEDAIKICKDAALKFDLIFKRFDPRDPENWFGTAAPYIDFFAANSLRFNEVRTGHGNMPISKDGDRVKMFPVDKYGLNGSHHILLEGSSYPPEKRGAMAQSVGPMTALLCHIRAEEKYRKKWTDASKRAMAHIPIIDEILDVVKGRQASEIRSIISLLADILLITTSRQANRMFFPVNFLARCYLLKSETDKKKTEKKLDGFVDGEELLRGFNVSGNGGFYLYNMCSKLQWKLDGAFNENEAKQLVFHSIFGTYKEDLSILEQITDLGTWNTREEFGGKFQKASTSGLSVEFKPVGLKKYSKLPSANQTGLLATAYSQVCSIPVFSGRRRQNYTEDFFEQLGKRMGVVSTAKTIPQIVAALTEILNTLRQDLVSRGKKMELGTVEWRSVEGMDIIDGGAQAAEVREGRCKFFLGKKI